MVCIFTFFDMRMFLQYKEEISGEIRDNSHSCQSSAPSSGSSENDPNAYEMNNSGLLKSELRGNYTSYAVNDDDNRIQSLENQISKQQVRNVLLK